MNASRTAILATTMLMAALASPFAWGHARLIRSDPASGATLTAAPKEIVLTFDEKVEEAFSTITLADAGGKALAAGKTKVDPSNPAVLRLEVPILSRGGYTVTWAVAGRDGHRRKGNFIFSVK